MPLHRAIGAGMPKEMALFWQMRTPENKPVDVYIYASTLQAYDSDNLGPVGLLKRHRDVLEKVASEKFDQQENGECLLLHITLDDLMQTMTIDISEDMSRWDDI